MKFTTLFVLLNLLSSFAFAECETKNEAIENLLQVNAVASCEVSFYSLQAKHNEAIDLQMKIAELKDKSDETFVKEEKCALLKEAQKIMPDLLKTFKQCWTKTKTAVTACIGGPNMPAVKEAADSCQQSEEVSLNWAEQLKTMVAAACKK